VAARLHRVEGLDTVDPKSDRDAERARADAPGRETRPPAIASKSPGVAPLRSGHLHPALTLRRAVPVNVPHPDNEPAYELEDEEAATVLPVRLSVKVGRSDDPLEIEADQVAERIMRMPGPAASTGDGRGLRALPFLPTGGGRPLTLATRAFFEPRLGFDLGAVRIHSGPEVADTAAELSARAFAYGSDICLGAGEREGDRRLLGHELAHVIQASDPKATPGIIRRHVRTNTLFLWDLYESKGSDPANVADFELRSTIEYEDYTRADLVWKFSDTVAIAALRRSMDLFAQGVRGRRPNYIRAGRETRAAAHGLEFIQLTELGFTGDHMITSVPGWGASPGPTIDDPDGSAPVWSDAGVRHPVAYTKGTAPTMFARFRVTPAMTRPVPDVEVRAKVDNVVIGSASGLTMTGTFIESAGGVGRVNGIGGGVPVPGGSTSGQTDVDIGFEVSTDAGKIWFQAGNATVRFYFTEATPIPPGGRLREDALDIATLAALFPPIPEKLARFIQALVFYDPAKAMDSSFAISDAVMEALTVPHQCDTQAFLMRYLLMTLGLTADVDYFWRGTPGSVIVYRMTSAPGWHGPSYQYDRPSENLATARPHFLFHALTNVGGTRFDPTYGQSSVGAILESAPGATDQFAPRSTFLALTVVGSPWRCPH
jgi:hypothetical protein